MLVAHTHVLHVYDVFLARDAVAQLVVYLIEMQRLTAVALAVVDVVIESGNLRLVFQRMKVVSQAVCRVKVLHGGDVVAHLDVNLRQCQTRFHGVPAIVGGRHYFVSLAIFGYRLRPPTLLLVKASEVGVAERNTEVRLCQTVLLHRSAIERPGRVYLAFTLVERSEVGVIDGLTEMAAKTLLAFEGSIEYGVGSLGVAEREADVADAVERNHTVLTRRAVILKAELLAEMQSAVMIVYGLIEDAHASEVGADVVKRLNSSNGVAELLCQLEFACVAVDGLDEEIRLTVDASKLLACTHLQHAVALALRRIHKTVEAMLALHLIHDAVSMRAQGLKMTGGRRRMTRSEEKHDGKTRYGKKAVA